MAVCRRCGNQMADTAAACPACGELRYQPPQPAAAAPTPQYAAPAQQPQYAPQQAAYPQQPAYSQPQQGYASPAAQPAFAIPAVSAEEAKGFIGALFDLSFTAFITTKLVKVLYILCIVGGAFGALGMIGSGFMAGATSGLIAVVVAPLGFLAAVIFARVYLELVIVIFRGVEHLAEIDKKTKR